MVKNTELNVSAIKDGTVIDHIPAAHLFKVIAILRLDKIKNQITFGTNLDSQRMGHKAIIKVTDKFFEADEINKIALVAPDAKLNIIRNYKVVEKKEVAIPEIVKGIVRCFNPKCITNNEAITTSFSLINGDDIALRCHYCEKITSSEHLYIL